MTKLEDGYHEIIQNPKLFLQKLHAFHSFNGTKFRVPTLGGNRLDLHRLFLEVTSRGGIEKLMRDEIREYCARAYRWKEVIRAFNFPSTTTNASFVLRRYYLSLLYHFEQLYYFQKEESYISSPDQESKSACRSTLPHANDGVPSNQLPVSLNLEKGSLVTGIIDGKFDYGYLITVNVGAENLKGVLYHTYVDPNASKSLSSSNDPSLCTKRKNRMAF